MKTLHDARPGSIVQFVGPINAQIFPYQYFLVIGFVDGKAVLSSLLDEEIGNAEYLQGLADNLVSSMDCPPKFFEYFNVVLDKVTS